MRRFLDDGVRVSKPCVTDTRGLGIMSSRFTGYDTWKGEIAGRNRGSLVAMESGGVTSYQIENLQQRSTLFEVARSCCLRSTVL